MLVLANEAVIQWGETAGRDGRRNHILAVEVAILLVLALRNHYRTVAWMRDVQDRGVWSHKGASGRRRDTHQRVGLVVDRFFVGGGCHLFRSTLFGGARLSRVGASLEM